MTTEATATMQLGRRAASCRMCGSCALERYLDLGHMAPADQFLRAEQLAEPTVRFPLEVYVCNGCGLSQLGYVVAPEILYQQEYPYEASTTRAGQHHFRAFAASVARRFELGARDLVVDIGSNVGVLLGGFAAEGTRVLGVDPAPNIAAIANARGVPTIARFFGAEAAAEIVREHGRASVVCGTNVFAHVDDLDGFMRAVDSLLAEDGIFIFEAPYFVNLLRSLEYDTIYHEHLSYISVAPLGPFLSRYGMRIFDIREVDIHGGSFRIFIDRNRRPRDETLVQGFIERERAEGAHDVARLRRFADAVAENREQLTSLLRELRSRGKRIAGVSAPAKGMTLLNYCGIGRETLDYVTEKSRLKIGRYTPGGHIPVVGDEELLADRPDYALLLAWNFADEIIENLSAAGLAGGQFIIPIPEPRIVTRARRAVAA